MRTSVAIAAWLVLLAPSSAAAFEDFDSFGAPVVGAPVTPPEPPNPNGGGQGRYFTGSLSDGFSCAVCHFGGTPNLDDVEFEINPDPFEDGYRQGETYEITITGRDLESWAATIELVDAQGEAAGDLELIPLSAQSPADQCAIGTRPDDLTAAHIITLADPPREVAGVDECDAERLRVIWEAPDTATGGVWLNAAVVAADGTGDAANDHTVVIALMLPPFGTDPEAGRVTNACAASPAFLGGAGHGRNGAAVGLLALAWLGLLRRRR